MIIQTTYDLHRVIEAEIAKLSEDDRVWWLRFTATAAMSMRRQQLRITVIWEHNNFGVGFHYSITNKVFVVVRLRRGQRWSAADAAWNWKAYKTAPETAAGIIMLLRKYWLPEVAA